MDGFWGFVDLGSYHNVLGETPAGQEPPAEAHPHQSNSETGCDASTALPSCLKFPQDRGKARSTAELENVFKLQHKDLSSKDMPRVFELICGYLIGLESLKEELQSTNTPCEKLKFDDWTSDADCVLHGMNTTIYQERWQQMKEHEKIGSSRSEIHQEYLCESCKVETEIAELIQHMRSPPSQDTHYCKCNLIIHTNNVFENWKFLSTVSRQLQHEEEALKRSEYPCVVKYSDIELFYGTDACLQLCKNTDIVDIPESWKRIDKMHSKDIRITAVCAEKHCKSMKQVIEKCISEMDDQRQKSYATMRNRYCRLMTIEQKLAAIQTNECSVGLTAEEIWYNASSLEYVDMYHLDAEIKQCLPEEYIWENTKKNLRHELYNRVASFCSILHQRYGEIVATLRTRREQEHGNIKTHVSELQLQVQSLQKQMGELNTAFSTDYGLWAKKDFETQQANAHLTNQLEEARDIIQHSKTQNISHYQRIIEEQNFKYQRQMEQNQANKAEMRNQIKELKTEKENLLTRLSKIAGSKLVHGNPAITDLSDANRPTKLSERYSELYDNDWTDALEELTDRNGIVKGEEVVCTKTLLAILIEAFTFCCETEAEYVKTIRQSLTSLPGSDPDTTEQNQKKTGVTCTTLTHDQTQQLDDLVKTCVPMLTTDVESKFVTLMEKRFEHVIKLACGLIKSDSQMPLSEQIPLTQMHTPEMTTCTDVQSTTHDNADDGRNQPSTLEKSESTRNSTPAIPDLSANEQAAYQTGTSPSDQEPNDHVAAKSHRQFSHDHPDDMSDQGNQQNENTCHGPHTADTTGLSRFSSLEKTIKFTKCCVNLCWLMIIQNPPLHMDTELAEDSDINTDFYKNYTHKGEKVGYLVWPALFLHKGGPLLYKGIVQPLSKKKGKNT